MIYLNLQRCKIILLSLDKNNINLVELLSQIMEQFNYQFKSEGIKGRTDFSEDKLIINADANKLVRAFENLISNAMKYGKDGKYIDIVTKKEDNMAIVQIINYGEQYHFRLTSYIRTIL